MAKAKQTEEHDMDMSDDMSMGVIELDENLDETPEPELLPAAWYPAEVQNVEIRQNQKGTGSYFSVKFVISPDDFPANYDVDNWPDGIPLYFNLLRVPTAGDRRAKLNIKRFMETLGLPTDVSTIDAATWIGRPAKVKVEHNTYEGTTREAIARNGVQKAD